MRLAADFVDFFDNAWHGWLDTQRVQRGTPKPAFPRKSVYVIPHHPSSSSAKERLASSLAQCPAPGSRFKMVLLKLILLSRLASPNPGRGSLALRSSLPSPPSGPLPYPSASLWSPPYPERRDQTLGAGEGEPRSWLRRGGVADEMAIEGGGMPFVSFERSLLYPSYELDSGIAREPVGDTSGLCVPCCCCCCIPGPKREVDRIGGVLVNTELLTEFVEMLLAERLCTPPPALLPK
ncbi:hypothetical protein G7K_2189-t1 [Saitoella complicata NRRL Y-17804]|uniref:Uncharacterized protein n=1 Tax=Saitoella complicata (strain BCRC 22490 / CBS 7301 / JCM 7358 / NBRC 10748 / NRRL Y-17804) TaxID=698492 RepID=A0A0E9NDS9_SAICN|nr:hypothetical protein G7K_2189-t1 [Saitoella complicata NRRL Y-17804]